MVQVSVIMPAYNASKTIEESILSVMNQTFQYWELIIVNDGSVDETLTIVERLVKKDARLKLIDLKKNAGLPAARNQGVMQACGKYIAFLDSDDTWAAEKLKFQMDFHLKRPTYAISHTNYIDFNEKGIIKRPWKIIMEMFNSKEGHLLPELYYKNVIGVLTVMVEKSVLEELNGFDAGFWTLEDQDLWIRIAEKGYEFGYIPQKLAFYRVAPGSMSRTIGRYKRSCKKLISKHIAKISKDGNISNLVWGNYYRNIGTSYFKKANYPMAKRYFFKSIRLHGFRFISFTTVLYLMVNEIKQHL